MAVGGIVLFVLGIFVPPAFFRQTGIEYLAYLRASDELKVHEKFTSERIEILKLRQQHFVETLNEFQQRLNKLNSNPRVAATSEQAERLENQIKDTERQIESITDASHQASLELELKKVQVKSEETVSINQRRDSRLFMGGGWVVAFFGAVFTYKGMRRWQTRVQVFEDRKLKREAESAAQPKSRAPSDATVKPKTEPTAPA